MFAIRLDRALGAATDSTVESANRTTGLVTSPVIPTCEPDPAKLDARESYYIGLYNADKDGYNDTKGNDWKAYERGQVERNRSRAAMKNPGRGE